MASHMTNNLVRNNPAPKESIMFEVLSGYLEVTATPEQKTSCLEACRVLSDAGITDHEFLIEQELAIADLQSSDFAINLIEGILKPVYVNQLNEFGVTLNASAELPHYVDVFRGLVNTDNYEDTATLYTLCDSSEGVAAALADILALMGAYKAVDYLTWIDHVDEALIDKIAGLHEDDSAVEPNPSEDAVMLARMRYERLVQCAETALDPPALAFQDLNNGGRLGLPLSILIESHLNTLALVQPPRLGVELLAFAAISNVSDLTLKDELSKVVDRLGLDPALITVTDIQLNRLLPKVLHG
jgi:hypothetical protein